MIIFHHVYRCELCDVIFGVDQAYVDQSSVVCPLCNREEGLKDLGYNEITEEEE